MTGDVPDDPAIATPKPAASPFPGMDWAQSMLDGPVRFQAALAAETLRRFNVPILDALARQREFAESLAAASEQIAAAATQVEALARQHAEITERLQAALEPYLHYVDRLGDLGAGQNPGRT
jgi:hypothetical protein